MTSSTTQSEIDFKSDIFEEFEKKEEQEYSLSALIDIKRAREVGFNLTDQRNFQEFKRKFYDFTKRTNIVYYGLIEGEAALRQEEVYGDMMIPMVNQKAIAQRISKLKKKEDQDKINYLHLSAIQVLLKSTFSAGIDAPIKFIVRDDRLNNDEECIIATGKGNLIGGVLKFDINLQLSMSLLDKDLDRPALMKEGNHPFTAFYRMNYALTNSHHSLTFKYAPKIEVDKLFGNILKFENTERMFRLKPESGSLLRDDRMGGSFRSTKGSIRYLPSTSQGPLNVPTPSSIDRPFGRPISDEVVLQEEQPKMATGETIILSHVPITNMDVSNKRIQDLKAVISNAHKSVLNEP